MFRFSFIFLCLCVVHVQARDDIPDDIRYIESEASINEAAETLLLEAFTEKKFDQLFAEKVVFGPAIWGGVKQHPVFNGASLAPTNFHIPIGVGTPESRVEVLQGVLFQKPEEISLLVSLFETLKDKPVKVRPITPQEAQIYWGLIPYDIQEPVFTVEFGNAVFLMDFSLEDNKVFWVDELSRYNTGG